MQRKRVVVTLPRDAYCLLEQLAEREERAIDQQASFLLRRVLSNPQVTVQDVERAEADARR
jgi:hypothetical protein